MLYLGIDGGGSKTAYLLEDAAGNRLREMTGEGISWREGGVERVLSRLGEAFSTLECLRQSGPLCLCAGIPCYGENQEMDAQITAGLAALLPGSRRMLVNDAVLSWAGALGCRPGVSVVAGTGSLAYGRNGAGEEARCGGWSEHFSDEGSAYWLGLRTVNLYTRQADGREARGPLWALLRREMHANSDEVLLNAIEREVLPSRKRVAALQRVLLQAAQEGDRAAIILYRRAGCELAEMATTAAQSLALPEGYRVSCTGGLLHAGKLLLEPFCREVKAKGGVYQPAMGTPVEGAIQLARGM